MQCTICQSPAIFFQRYSGRYLCPVHLCADIESRAKRLIRKNRWLVRGDRIGVVSGLIHSRALNIFLNRLLSNRTDISHEWIVIPPEYKAGTPAWYSALSQIGIQTGCTRIALPVSADETAAGILCLLLQGDTSSLLSARIPGLDISCMQPLQEIPAEELLMYAQYLDKTGNNHNSPNELVNCCQHTEDIRNMIADFSSRHPSAPHALRRYREALRDLAGE